MSASGDGLDRLAARWRTTAAPADLIALAAQIPPESDRERLIGYLGAPLVVSPLAGGGETWLYVRSDPGRSRFESLSIAVSAAGRFLGLDRKPID